VTLVQKVEAAAEKLKAGFLKVMQETDGIVVPEAEKWEPMAAAMLDAVLPGSGNIAQIAEDSLVALAKVIDAGGAAAEANLGSLGFDQALIASAKQLIPTLKAAVAVKT
jgi:hypothetical protein